VLGRSSGKELLADAVSSSSSLERMQSLLRAAGSPALSSPYGQGVDRMGELADDYYEYLDDYGEDLGNVDMMEEVKDRPMDAMEAHRLTASTLRALQGGGRRREARPGGFARRQGQPLLEDRQGQDGLKVTLAEMEKALGLGSGRRGSGRPSGTEEKRLVAQVNAVAVLDMIKDLQEEIKDINQEIDAENEKMAELKETRSDVDDSSVRNAAKVSTKETMKELALQKEDTTMKKVMAQMMLMKQIKKKKVENSKLEQALRKLADRRKIINSALKEQQSIAEEKRHLAQREVERQKAVMEEKEEMIRQLRKKAADREERERREHLKREQEKMEEERGEEEELEEEQRRNELIFQLKQEAESEELNQRKQLLEQLRKKQKEQKRKKQGQLRVQGGGEFLAKASLLEGHRQLVDQSNERILARIEEMKLERQREAVMEQERLLDEQQAAIGLLQQRKRLRKQQQGLRLRPRPPPRKASSSTSSTSSTTTALSAALKKLRKPSLAAKVKEAPFPSSLHTPNPFTIDSTPSTMVHQAAAKLRLSQAAPLLNLNKEERRQVMEWMDLERNAAILEKTDKAIAAKVRGGGQATLGRLTTDQRVTSAAQVLLEAGDSISDSEIDDLLGLGGVDDGLSEEEILGTTDILFPDGELDILNLDEDDLLFEDYEYGDDEDYGDYDYDDYEEIIYDYEYEEEPVAVVEVVEVVEEEVQPVRPTYHQRKKYHGHVLHPAPASAPHPPPRTHYPAPPSSPPRP